MACRGADLGCTHISQPTIMPPPPTHTRVCVLKSYSTNARIHPAQARCTWVGWTPTTHDMRGAPCPNVNMAKLPPRGTKYPRMAVQHGGARPYVNIRRQSHVRFGRMLIFDQNFDRNFVATRPKLTWRRIGREIDAVC